MEDWDLDDVDSSDDDDDGGYEWDPEWDEEEHCQACNADMTFVLDEAFYCYKCGHKLEKENKK